MAQTLDIARQGSGYAMKSVWSAQASQSSATWPFSMRMKVAPTVEPRRPVAGPEQLADLRPLCSYEHRDHVPLHDGLDDLVVHVRERRVDEPHLPDELLGRQVGARRVMDVSIREQRT
jgi:hypothetical protein